MHYGLIPSGETRVSHDCTVRNHDSIYYRCVSLVRFPRLPGPTKDCSSLTSVKLEYLREGSPECPVIRMYDFGQAEAKQLRELVKSLATGDRENVEFHNEAWVESVGGCSLTLRRGNRNQGILQSQTLRFECVLSSDGWNNAEGLLGPFSESNTTDFQWLTNHGRIALLISRSGHW